MRAISNRKFKLSSCKLILAMMFTICMFTIALPITAHADTNLGDNAGGDGSAGADKGAVGGATQNNHGYRFYVVDSSGTVVSDVIDFVSIEGVSCDYNYKGTRLGNGIVKEQRSMPDGMPKPFYHDGHNFVGNGEALRQWCLAENSEGGQNLVQLMHNYLGESILELFEDTAYEYYVVLEPITWHGIFYYTYTEGGERVNNSTGKSFYGTFYNWMQFYNQNNWPANFTSPLDQKVLGTCLQLVRDEPKLGLSDPGEFTEYFTLSNVGNQGWGMHLYYNQDMFETQTTCNEDEGDKPHPAPPESDGKILIVKNYRYSEDGGSTFKDAGCFVKENTSGKIIIEQEQSYKIKEWRVSTNILNSVFTLKWYDALNDYDENGTEACELNLKGKVGLYILYEKVTDVETQTTCDENAGDRPHTAPDESTGTVTIIKNYRYSEDGGSTFKDAGCFVKENTSGKIIIEQEQSYKIKEWRVSTDIKRNVNSVNWESEVNNWNRKDNIAGTITLAGNVCLYILYEKVDEAPIEPAEYDFELQESQITKRVKFSDGSREAYKIITNIFSWTSPAHTTTACRSHGGYGHVLDCTTEWDRAPFGGTPHDHAAHGETSYYDCGYSYSCPTGCTINHTHHRHVNTDDGCLGYKKLTCTSLCPIRCALFHEHHRMHDSVDCYEVCNKVWDVAPVGGVPHTHTNSCYDTPCSTFAFTDSQVKLGIKLDPTSVNKAVVSNKHGVTYDAFTVNTITSNTHYGEFYRTNSGEDTQSKSKFNLVTVLFRGNDKLTLANWKNAATGKSEDYLTSISSDSAYNFKSANTPQGTRKAGNEYLETTSTKFINSSPDTQTTYGGRVGRYSCEDDKSYTFTKSDGTSSDYTIQDIKVKIKVFWANGVSPTSTATLPSTQLAGTVSFYPYIRMRYDDNTDNDKSIYVLGQRQRTATFYDYASVGIGGGNGRLSINSNQWSTHASAQANILDAFGSRALTNAEKERVKASVLPGGATLSIAASTNEVRTISVVTMQAYLAGTGKTQVTNTQF